MREIRSSSNLSQDVLKNSFSLPICLIASLLLEGDILSLTELSAREVAASIPFELVEVYHPPVPEQLQLKIASWSFPQQEEDIRLYSCLANGSADEFSKGELYFKSKCVKDPLQIGKRRPLIIFLIHTIWLIRLYRLR